MSRKRLRTLTVVGIVALVASGVIAFIWSQQRRLIYFPSPGPVPSASAVLPAGRDVVIETSDGMRLGAWYFPHTSGGRGPAVLVCNGNAGDRSMRAELAVALNQMGLSALLIDYRGYGGNPGKPSEEGLAADAEAAQDWLAEQIDVDPKRIAYFGESLGAAVAVGLAVRRPPAALVLRSPFTSLADVGAVQYPWLPLRRLLLDRYPSIERIASVSAPVLVIAGSADDIVPPALSERLVDAAAEPKRYVVVPGVGHNDRELLDGQVMLDAIRSFLAQTPVLGRPRS
ncbi:alpha/beta hydrolase [Mycobacterium spongiae]|uniref:Prolyl oligopeptidase family serine peptidase n=1 Tax=Mycobacterium spongiae TaxID=886343 RepID=A0A975PXE8_9MYCO|nr:alpha/beta hydrolase [Mycobacterium spongiae]QUR68125.1 prolyl oligopeptidase family serine peptidase [Mycobacterium spongiae]